MFKHNKRILSKQSNTIESNTFVPGKNIVYFSLEMPYENCFNRLLSSLSGVPYKKIENAKCNKEEISHLVKENNLNSI